MIIVITAWLFMAVGNGGLLITQLLPRPVPAQLPQAQARPAQVPVHQAQPVLVHQVQLVQQRLCKGG